jgi:hypothetical protein
VDSRRQSRQRPAPKRGIAKLITPEVVGSFKSLRRNHCISQTQRRAQERRTGSLGALGPIVNLHFRRHPRWCFARSKLILYL